MNLGSWILKFGNLEFYPLKLIVCKIPREVFDACNQENGQDIVFRLPAKVTFTDAYERITYFKRTKTLQTLKTMPLMIFLSGKLKSENGAKNVIRAIAKEAWYEENHDIFKKEIVKKLNSDI